MKIKFLTAFILSFCALAASAQLEWSSTDYDFGIIKEADGAKTGSVSFVNRGKEATQVISVRPSCGCTDASFTEGPIAPGDTAVVTFTYDPKRRPGRFEKTVKVYTGANNDLTTIRIRGTVVGTPETLYQAYPVELGRMRISDRSLDAGIVRYGTARHLFLRAVNQSDKTIYPTFTSNVKALSVNAAVDSIPPGETLSVSFYLNTRDLDAPGPLDIPVLIAASREATPDEQFELHFTAQVVPDTQNLTAEEVDNGPRIFLLPDLVDLKTVSSKKKEMEVEFAISNEGRSPLKISRIFANTTAVTPQSYPTVIQAGKKGKARLILNVEELPAGPHSIHVQIMSNDPLNPVRTLRIALEKD